MTLSREKLFIFGFFLGIIALGSLGLSLPFSTVDGQGLAFTSAVFMATSAVCVTGLSLMPLSELSFFGQSWLLFLIQVGGLGIITVSTLYLILPWARISFRDRKVLKEFFVEKVGHRPRRIIASILLLSLSTELIGSLLLWASLPPELQARGWFYAFFHAVSAFNNAGFGLEADSLWSWRDTGLALGLIQGLIVFGGLGFVVLKELVQRLSGRSRFLSLHSRLVLGTSAVLIALGFLVFWALEGFTDPGNALFYSITTRTAGFNVTPVHQMSPLSQTLTLPFMVIGASPGSTGGGLKTTTAFLFLWFLIKGHRSETETQFGPWRLGQEQVYRAVVLVSRYLAVAAVLIFALYLTEHGARPGVGLLSVAFESLSALGTVGLSLGLTGDLTEAGRWIIILTMFIGRIGLFTFALKAPPPRVRLTYKRPLGEVLIG